MAELMFGILAFLLVVGLPIAGIIAVVRMFRANPNDPNHKPITAEQVKHGLIGIAIAVVGTVFVVLFTNALFPDTDQGTNFIVGTVLSVLLLGGGFATRTVPTIGNSLIGAGVLSLLYFIGSQFDNFTDLTKLVISLIALAATITVAYLLTNADHRLNRPAPTLRGFRAFVVGLLSFIFSSMVTSFSIALVQPQGFDPFYGSSDSSSTAPFVTSLAVATIWLMVGGIIRYVPSVSTGLLFSGVLSILGSLIFIASELGGSAPVIIAGLVFIALIAFAYRYLHQANPTNQPPAAA